MDSHGSVTLWIKEVKAGNHQAARGQLFLIWERYFARMVGLARKRLEGEPKGLADEEDVALSAFNHCYCRMERGELLDVADRNDLWKLLMGITASKARDHVRKEKRLKRGSGNVRGEACLDDPSSSTPEGRGLEQVAGSAATPESQAIMADELQRLLSLLGEEDDTLRLVAEWKLQGDDNAEIQAKMSCSPRTVERKLETIREMWAQEMGT